MAQRGIDRILALAVSDLASTSEPPARAPRRFVLVFGYVLALALAASVAYLLLRGRS